MRTGGSRTGNTRETNQKKKTGQHRDWMHKRGGDDWAQVKHTRAAGADKSLRWETGQGEENEISTRHAGY